MENEIEEFKPWGMELKVYLMAMHLSQLAGFIIPLGGLILPLVMWLTNKEHNRDIDDHGKVIVNWVLSAIIYSLVCFVLTFILVGIFAFIVLGICALVFAVVGAIKAHDGVLWEYPVTIKFLK